MRLLTTNLKTNMKMFFLPLVCLVSLPAPLLAQFTTYSQQVQADTFVSSGDPNSNFGLLGALEIAA